jgi:hypothetical protein
VPESVAPRSDFSKPEPNKAERPKPAPQQLASVKTLPVPPPPLLASPTRQDTEDAQSVLTRLRQLTPASTPARQANPPPPAESRPRQLQSPSLPKLTAARVALASGRIEDARRLLQEVQLQLVFRPVTAGAGEDSPSTGKVAAEVARALDALSADDIPLSRRYVDAAVDDLSGTGANLPIQESQARTTGYAPAYPPR